MGIPMSIDVRDEGDTAPAVRAAFDLMHEADRRFSTYRADSEVAAVNRGDLQADEFSADMREVLAIADHLERESGGAFTARIPGRPLDLNGVVKGWAAQGARSLLVERGLRDFCINAGGDVVVRGVPTGHARWNVGIRSPWDASTHLAVLGITDGAIATSGHYERGNHIVDGRNGGVPTEFASVTVGAQSLTTADALATAVFVLGRDGLAWGLENGADFILAFAPDGTPSSAGPVPFAAAEQGRRDQRPY